MKRQILAGDPLNLSRWFGLFPIFAITVAARLGAPALVQDQTIVVASTTSTEDTGLFSYLLPIVKQKTGAEVKVLAQGTGQALDTARHPVMYNDSVIIGPTNDPAGIKGKDVLTALQAIRTEPGQASHGEKGSGLPFHRLVDFAGGTGCNRRVQDQRSAVLLSRRERSERLRAAGTRGLPLPAH